MSKWIEIEVGDTLYEVEVTNFEVSRRSRDQWQPDDPGEIDLGKEVRVYAIDWVPTGPGSGNMVPKIEEIIAYHDFLKLYAEHVEETDMGKAERELHDECYDTMCHLYEQDFPDP